MAADLYRHRLSLGGSEKLQLTALLGAFKVAVELEQKAKDGEKRKSARSG